MKTFHKDVSTALKFIVGGKKSQVNYFNSVCSSSHLDYLHFDRYFNIFIFSCFDLIRTKRFIPSKWRDYKWAGWNSWLFWIWKMWQLLFRTEVPNFHISSAFKANSPKNEKVLHEHQLKSGTTHHTVALLGRFPAFIRTSKLRINFRAGFRLVTSEKCL